MPVRLSELQRQRVGATAAVLLGLGLAVAGVRLVAIQYLLAEPARTSGVVVGAGRTQTSRGGNVNFVRYEFVDPSGTTRTGTSSGYPAIAGDAILVEYSPRLPWVHRVAGEGRTTAYRWRWAIAGAGLFFLAAGTHWAWSLRTRRGPAGA